MSKSKHLAKRAWHSGIASNVVCQIGGSRCAGHCLTGFGTHQGSKGGRPRRAERWFHVLFKWFQHVSTYRFQLTCELVDSYGFFRCCLLFTPNSLQLLEEELLLWDGVFLSGVQDGPRIHPSNRRTIREIFQSIRQLWEGLLGSTSRFQAPIPDSYKPVYQSMSRCDVIEYKYMYILILYVFIIKYVILILYVIICDTV